MKLGLLLPPPPGVLSRTLLQDGPQAQELVDVGVGERLALDAHVDRVQRARGLVLLVEAEVVQLALERRVVLVPEVERELALELDGVGDDEVALARPPVDSSCFASTA